jgi:hypothetical protein
VGVLRWFLRWFLRATVSLRLFRYIFFFIDTTEQVFELHFKIILLTNNTHIHNMFTYLHYGFLICCPRYVVKMSDTVPPPRVETTLGWLQGDETPPRSGFFHP